MVNWDPYLASIRNSYAQWWQVYTLTDVEGRKPKQQQRTPMLFNGLMVQTIKSEQPQRDENREEYENPEEIERLPVLDGLRKYAADHVLLVGRPGSGKSTTLVRLLGDEGIQGKIPVLVELRYYQTSVLELVRNFLKRHGVLLNSTEIERLLFEGEFWLLIDGVNELPSEAARVDLTQFRKDYQKRTPMIFTTRDLGVGGDLGIQKKLEMQPLSVEQMSEFVRKYLPQQGEQMLQQLGDRLREFGQTPLLLMMLCALFQDKGEIPSNLGLVFRSFTQFYSDNIKQDVKVSEESRGFWTDLLQELGFVMTAGDKPKEITVAIPKTKAEEILTNYLRQSGCIDPKVRARTWLKDLLNHHLIQQSGDLIEFRHQLIQEYYTAEYLLKQLPRLSDQELQQNYLNYLKWTEPLVLMLQLVDDQAQAQQVVSLGLVVDWQLGARLAGAVKPEFQEQTVGLVAGLKVPTLVKVELLGITGSEKAIPELRKYLDDHNSYIRNMAAEVLEKIGTEATIDPLIKLLDDDHYLVRIRAADALGKIGTEATIDPLTKLLDDDHYLVRIRAADALGKIGTEATIDPLISLDYHNYYVRIRAADALGKIGTEAKIDTLIKLLDYQDSNLRIRAAEALGKIGKEATIYPLIKLLDYPEYWVRKSAAEALAKIGTEAAINPLIKYLDDPHSYVRIMAADALGKIATEAGIDPLIKCLDDPHSYVRIMAANALGKIGTEATIYGLIKCLDDSESDMRRIAAYALGEIGTEATIYPLIKLLDDNDSDVRKIVADALGKIGTEVVIDPLIKLLDDHNYYVRSRAADALGEIGTEAAIDPLIKLLDDNDSDVRSSGADALGEIGTEATIDPLIKLLDDYRSSVRSRAADALGEIGTEATIDPLIKLLDDYRSSVRSSAASALGKIGKEATIDPLIKLLDDNDSDVRRSAAEALGKIGTEATIDPLIKLLDDPDSDLRIRVADALGKIGTEATIDPLIKLLDDDDSDLRIRVADALGKIGTEATIDPLIKLLDDDDYSVRIHAAEALEKIGTEATIDPLIKLLDDDDYRVRIRAAKALGKIGTEVAIDPLIKLLYDDDYSVCRSAADALGEIGKETTIPKLINLLNKEESAATNDKDIFSETINTLNTIQERYQIYNPTYRPKPTQTMYILHLSDLHITTPEQATLWSNQLAQDLIQDLQIPHLDALILSGDIANYSTPDEYQAAQQFLDNLRQDFSLDSKQIVLVPGNHDLNWELAKRGYQLLDLEDYDGELKEGHYIKGEDVIRVRDEAKYQQRFAHFSQFYQAIKAQPYPLDYDQQAIIDYFPEQNLLILGLNSAWELDRYFRDRASIHSGALSNALTEIRRNPDYGNCLKIAVWHHALNSAGSDRITDQGFMEQLAQAGFRFFLHGHIHKAETSLFRYDLSPSGRKLDQIGAGTFGAPTKELIPGYPWQYNLLKIEDNQLTVYTRRREEINGAWKPDSRWTQGPGVGALDYYSIEL
ncbi:MAG: hypothetical protein F6J94_24545 [Moorea sp. SIO1F2]|uniref:HEAT repeat domain-containing protein n=1 Tax=Moorena sp. SIO1F2 TaxID=2607819 RepID=UPI0013B6C22A|nr:HEAT repeat domain-containing protein [Moorena sp. SIO1F2]NET84968.1 hypothetical protein [Moorena sp. SIO1F2]